MALRIASGFCLILAIVSALHLYVLKDRQTAAANAEGALAQSIVGQRVRARRIGGLALQTASAGDAASRGMSEAATEYHMALRDWRGELQAALQHLEPAFRDEVGARLRRVRRASDALVEETHLLGEADAPQLRPVLAVTSAVRQVLLSLDWLDAALARARTARVETFGRAQAVSFAVFALGLIGALAFGGLPALARRRPSGTPADPIHGESKMVSVDAVSMLIHDMRSPLTVVLGNAQILADDLEGTPNAEAAEQAAGAALQLRDMVDRILESGPAGSPLTRLDLQPCDLNDLGLEALQVVRQSKRSCRPQLRGSITSMVVCDPAVVRRVLWNLLTNAVSVSPPRSPITLELEERADSVTVWISDCGPGIPATQQQFVFQKFARLGHDRPPGSMGLGLAFCRRAIEAHGGEIGVTSDGRSGSRFWFTLPLTVPDFEGDEAARRLGSGGGKMRPI